MGQIFLITASLKKPSKPIWYLYKNTKVKVRLLASDTDYFDIVAGVQQDTLAPYPLIICQDYVLWTFIDLMKESGLELTKKRSRRYPARTVTDADYADDIAFLENAPGEFEICHIVWKEQLVA